MSTGNGRAGPRPDAQAFERDMRARFVTRENLERLFRLVLPHLDPDQPTLVYILTQSDRLGHLTLEPQILKTLYGDRYRRMVIVTGRMDRPGTNPWVRDCLGDGFIFVETDDQVILTMGYIDGGMADLKRIHLLLQSPRMLITDCWRRVAAGLRMAPLQLPDALSDRCAGRLRSLGFDPDAPFAAFHMRTMRYLPGHTHHGHRSVSAELYSASVRAVLDAGYQVVRVGEPGLQLPAGDWDGYLSLPDAVPDDRGVDLFVLARCAFGVLQNSGPMAVLAGFGRRTLRTNLPIEHLTIPHNRDLMLFKPYRDVGTGRFLTYREILDRRLAPIARDAEFAEHGVELVENSPDALAAATREMLACIAGTWQPDRARNDRFFALGAAYEAAIRGDPWFHSEHLDFYGYAHPLGWVTSTSFDQVPGFLD